MLEESRFEDGRWTGLLGASTAPEVSVSLDGSELGAAQVEPEGKRMWRLSLDLPRAALSDGAHVLLFQDAQSGERLGSATLVLGAEADTDFRAELTALRAEVELLKRAIRRLHQPD